MKVAFILPYFGKFNNLFPFYLQSCGKNPDITWFIFSDNNKPLFYPSNVQFIRISFEELKNKIQNFFDFPISLENPYKLCDFKPSYGDIFAEYLSNYDYWGYCDCDLLWGNIQEIIAQYIGKYDQIGHWGHCSLYRNNKSMTQLYRKNDAYKIAFSNFYSFLFDELAFQKMLKRFSFTQAPDFLLGDFQPRRFTFESISPCGNLADITQQQIFTWEQNGTLLRHYIRNGSVASNEIYYIHFLKRRIEISSNIKLDKRLLIVPNKIIEYDKKITCDLIAYSTKNRFYKEYWKNGLSIEQIKKKLIHRFSRKRKEMQKKIFSLVENDSIGS